MYLERQIDMVTTSTSYSKYHISWIETPALFGGCVAQERVFAFGSPWTDLPVTTDAKLMTSHALKQVCPRVFYYKCS